jgi:hypothetical protein
MTAKNKKQKAAPAKSTSKKRGEEKHEFETMSQIQNRYGNGRQQSGSDGGRVGGRGMNH